MQVVFSGPRTARYVGASSTQDALPTRRNCPRSAATGAPSAPERMHPVNDASGASGDVELIQLLSPEGERIAHSDYAYGGGDDQVRELYRDMVMTRRIDQEAIALQRQGELGIWPSSLGQEA